MKIYSVNGGLWPIFLGFAIVLLVLLGLGSLLLTTPLGLAILAFWAVSSVYRKWQARRYYKEAASQNAYGYWESDQARDYQSDDSNEAPKEATFVKNEFEQYRHSDSVERKFSVDDRRNAEDVDFKEV